MRVFSGHFSRQTLSMADYNSIEVGVGVSRFEKNFRLDDSRNNFTILIPLRTRPPGLAFLVFLLATAAQKSVWLRRIFSFVRMQSVSLSKSPSICYIYFF